MPAKKKKQTKPKPKPVLEVRIGDPEAPCNTSQFIDELGRAVFDLDENLYGDDLADIKLALNKDIKLALNKAAITGALEEAKKYVQVKLVPAEAMQRVCTPSNYRP